MGNKEVESDTPTRVREAAANDRDFDKYLKIRSSPELAQRVLSDIIQRPKSLILILLGSINSSCNWRTF